MMKKNFAALRKVLKKAETVYIERDGSTVRVAEGHCIAWMPVEDYAEHLGDLLPDVSVASRWTRRKGQWEDGGPDLTEMLSSALKDDDSRLSSVSPLSFNIGGTVCPVILSETSAVVVNPELFKACDDLVGGEVFASERNKPVWFYGGAYDNGPVGAFLLPINVGPQFVESVKNLVAKMPGAFSSI